ncbi:AsmA family protein [Escherichia coli]
MLALRGEGTPFPVQADFRSGNTRVAFDGVVNDPMKMGGVDLRLKFSGDSRAISMMYWRSAARYPCCLKRMVGW